MRKNKTYDTQKINAVKTKKWIIKNNRFNSLSQSINRNKQNLINKYHKNLISWKEKLPKKILILFFL